MNVDSNAARLVRHCDQGLPGDRGSRRRPGQLAARRAGGRPVTRSLRPVAVNLLGVVEQPEFGEASYQVDRDGRPYVPAGDGGIVLGARLGESVFARAADHAAPGACLVHPDQAARQALAAYCCIGNQAVVRTGRAAGARGVVAGKRGELSPIITVFAQDDLNVLPVATGSAGGTGTAGVRMTVPSKLAGNGIGRPLTEAALQQLTAPGLELQ
jgi:uncharacterized protein DUF4438